MSPESKRLWILLPCVLFLLLFLFLMLVVKERASARRDREAGAEIARLQETIEIYKLELDERPDMEDLEEERDAFRHSADSFWRSLQDCRRECWPLIRHLDCNDECVIACGCACPNVEKSP